MIQEPVVKGMNVIGLLSGEIYSQANKEERTRAAIWVRKDIKNQFGCEMVGSYTNMATIRLTIKDIGGEDATNVILSSIYMPSVQKGNKRGKNQFISEPVNQKIEELVEYCRKTNTELIIGCDSNAHHQAWGSKDNNIRGINLKEFIDREELFVINKGNTPTYIQGNKESIIDLTIATKGATELIDKWKVLDDMNQSDHNSIEFELTDVYAVHSRTKKKTNWIRMNTLMRKECKRLCKVEPESVTALDKMAE